MKPTVDRTFVFPTSYEDPNFIYGAGYPSGRLMGVNSGFRTHRPVFDAEKCIKCLFCYVYCPEGAIDQEPDGKMTVDLDYCKGCGVCAHECPKQCITMVKEDK